MLLTHKHTYYHH